MRLFEFEYNFADSLYLRLHGLQGTEQSSMDGQDRKENVTVPWETINHLMGNECPITVDEKTVNSVRGEIDPNSDLILDVTADGIVLNTKREGASSEPIDVPSAATSIPSMAHKAVSAAKL